MDEIPNQLDFQSYTKTLDYGPSVRVVQQLFVFADNLDRHASKNK